MTSGADDRFPEIGCQKRLYAPERGFANFRGVSHIKFFSLMPATSDSLLKALPALR